MGAWGWSRALRRPGLGGAAAATLAVGVLLFAQEAQAQEPPATSDATAPSAEAELPAPPPPPATHAAPSQVPEAAAAAEPTIEIRLEANHEDAGLYRLGQGNAGIDRHLDERLGGSRPRLKLCAAPCRLRVAPGDFVVAGPRLRESPAFAIAGGNQLVHVAADVGTEGAATGGIALAVVGGFTLLFSLPMVLVGAALETSGKEGGTDALIGGGIATAVGAGLLMGGVSMIVGSKTTVSVRSKARP